MAEQQRQHLQFDHDEDQPTQHPQHHFQPKIPHHHPHQRHNMNDKPNNHSNNITPRYINYNRPNFNAPKREHCICITITLLILGIIALVLWLAYHPTQPHFTLTAAAVYGLNTTSPPLMAITMQFTILIRNPNKRVSIYIDRLNAFVSYKNQPITPHVMLPPLYLEKHSTVALSPVIGGSPVPVSAEVSNGFVGDEGYGVVGLKLALLGRLKWKAGDIKSAHYGVYVKCDMMVGLKKGSLGQVPLIGTPVCDVDM